MLKIIKSSKMKTKFILILILIALSQKCKPQVDSSKFSVSFNLINNLFNQHTIEIGFRINNKYSIGLGGGFINSNLWWNKNQSRYSGTNEEYPFGHYDGWIAIINFKQVLGKKHWYFQTSFFYKYIYYDHVSFTSSGGDDHPDSKWIRSEISNVYGVKLLFVKRITIINHIAIEPFLGISGRIRQREYFTFYNGWGLTKQSQFFPSLQAGLMLTVGDFKKNKK